MNETESTAMPGKLSGKLFLYRDPELLAVETHGTMGITPSERPFDFVRSERVLPLTLTEFGSAQKNYPIIFSNIDRPMPLAVIGALEETNLFVDADGKWEQMCYVPTYLRCYPFAFAQGGANQLAVVVDRAADTVTEQPRFPFFDGDQPSEHTKALMQLCAQYDADRRRTVEFCEKLRDMELLTPLRATYTADGATEAEPLAEYIGIDTEKLNALTKDQVFELHAAGFLSAIYLQLHSLENWRYLMMRREARG